MHVNVQTDPDRDVSEQTGGTFTLAGGTGGSQSSRTTAIGTNTTVSSQDCGTVISQLTVWLRRKSSQISRMQGLAEGNTQSVSGKQMVK